MRGLLIALVVAVLGFASACDDGTAGQLCDGDSECDDGFVCLTEVFNCSGTDCWGTCQRECEVATDCDAGDVCIWVQTARVCRPDDYVDP